MSLSDIIRSWFCSDLLAQLSTLESQISTLEDRISELENDIQEANNQHNALLAQYEAQTAELESLRDDYAAAITATSEAVNIPDISNIIDQAAVEVQLDPPNENHPTLNRLYGFIYDIETSDNEYYAYDEQTWKDILEAIHPEMKKAVGFGGTEAAECDNYAYTTAIFTALAFNKAGKNYQGAIGVAEGHYDPAIATTHAFNVILLDEKQY